MELQYILILIGVILAAILLYFGYTHLIKNKSLSQDDRSSTIDIEALVLALGGKDNIVDVKSSPSKVTITLKDNALVKVENIQALGASGIVEGKDNFSIIFGKQSPLIEEDLKRIL